MKKLAIYFFTILRILVGWHLLYEGVAKLYTPSWSAKGYLLNSQWIFADIFNFMASSPGILKVIDFLNVWGLVLIGISLFIGLLVRWSSVAGAILMLFYFLAHPSIAGFNFFSIEEGSYLWINKTVIELFMLTAFATLPSHHLYGADRLIKQWKEEKPLAPIPSSDDERGFISHRRELLRNLISIPFIGAFAYALYKRRQWETLERRFLPEGADATTGATLMTFVHTSLDELEGQVPKGKIKDMELSRLIMGGNLIGGWAHARDLMYVNRLVREYHSDERVVVTMQLAQKCGINAILTNPQLNRIIDKYHRVVRDGDMKFISDCGVWSGFIDGINLSLEGGADALYCQGGIADRLVQEGDLDQIAEGLELIRSAGKLAGIGAHRIETIQACAERGMKPDFWVKSLHHHNYWSAQHQIYRGNIWCYKPEETIEYMKGLEEPFIAFKVLAAGAIRPADGFQYAFDNGADFICVGMYDFQIVEDVNTCLDVLANVNNRSRPWRG